MYTYAEKPIAMIDTNIANMASEFPLSFTWGGFFISGSMDVLFHFLFHTFLQVIEK
jgi:hypothetical protein